MMKQQLSTFIKDTVCCLTNYFPFVFCITVCLKADILIAISYFLISVIFIPEINSKKMLPLLLSFIILGFNPEYALGASLVCGVLLVISSFYKDKLKQFVSSPFISGLMFSGALTTTILFTTDYFGIGATGGNVAEMIKSYISLGFHPNWRGVLYGTIVLVIMITFPRKFKIFSQYVSPSFIALVFTLILNLFLNPPDMISAVNELTVFDYSEYLSSRIGIIFDLKTLFLGLSLFIIYFYSVISEKDPKQKDFISCGIINVLFSGLYGIPIPCGIQNKLHKPLSKLTAIIFVCILYFVFSDYILRIPLHSCAVIVIVTAWNTVNWSEIKKQFNGILPFSCFIITVLISLLADLYFGVITAFVLSLCYSKTAIKK
ncbi:MAG: SulP family inorganic anion transporter [Clostridia bacterium]|nr:SulP family inorganic anion transporter [Clostridia bacterium]